MENGISNLSHSEELSNIDKMDNILPLLSPYTFILHESGKFYLFTSNTRTYVQLNEDLYTLLLECNGSRTIKQLIKEFNLSIEVKNLFKELFRNKIIFPKDENKFNNIAKPEVITDNELKYSHITIFPTHNCNLACKYCYARGGDIHKVINLQTTSIFLDWFFRQINYNAKFISMSFHGGGEPTVEYPLIRNIIENFRDRCKSKGIKPNIAIVSNGAFAKNVANWLIEEEISVNFSIDGPPDIQDFHRPFRSGRPSSPLVERNIKKFINNGKDVSARVTITDRSVFDMLRITRYLIDLGIRSIQLEPCFFVGRCKDTGINEPDVDLFIKFFLESFKLGLKHDVHVTYSGLRCLEGARDRFCGACSDSIALTPEGFLTSCYEVIMPEDPASKVFFIGKVNHDSGKIELDKSRIQVLNSRTTDNLDLCSSCFLKFNCAGDCLVKTFRDTGSIFNNSAKRCKMAQEINKSVIIQIAKEEIIPRNSSETSKYTFGDFLE